MRLAALPVATALLLTPAPAAAALPGFAEVKAAWRSSEAWLLDRHGEPLQRLRLDPRVRRLAWVPLAEVSPALQRSLLLSEDRRFLEHSGIDWRAVGSALGEAASGGPLRGASTISMQLAGLLAGTAGQGRRGLIDKLDQAGGALALERHWTKPQILEAYLNLLPLRGEAVGIGAAAEQLFGKLPIGLDAAEGALLAALARGPNAPPPRVAQRACLLLREQGLQALCGGLEGRAQAVFSRAASGAPASEDLAPQLAPHLARQLLTEPGQRLRSTLDAELQRLARDALRRHLRELADRGATDGAVVVLDNASGEVLAWVGSSGPLSAASEVDAVLAPRQAGSTLKPFLYGLAIDERRLTAASWLEDRAADLPTDAGLYLPQNHDRQFRGWVSLRVALASSLNLPAVRVAGMVTPDAMARTLRRLGMISVDKPGDHYGPSLALGSADVSLIELANAYRALANGGRASAPIVRRQGPQPARLSALGGGRGLGESAAFIITDILADRDARAASFGWDSPLVTRQWSAVKTGTSKDMRDSWCLGFSRQHTVGVWVGNAAGEPMRQVTGVRGAAPVWAELMAHLQRGAGSTPPPAPAGVLRQTVSFEPPKEPPRSEYFLRGTEQRAIRLAGAPHRAGIAYPPDQTRIALDPDIPPDNQRVLLRAQPGPQAGAARWLLNGRELGRGPQLAWFPQPGVHRIALRAADGSLLDEVGVEVRGARRVGPTSPCQPPTACPPGARPP
ncbi:MAG: penicillin-binding protein 1C [Betaproteobacteria bacterium]|nr:penicillin-binding protein 1C [Betaproteobacteria bacterium]